MARSVTEPVALSTAKPTTGAASGVPPMEPWNVASPNVNVPPFAGLLSSTESSARSKPAASKASTAALKGPRSAKRPTTSVVGRFVPTLLACAISAPPLHA